MSVIRVLGVPIRVQRYEDAITTLLAAARERRKLRAHFATVHSVVEAERDRSVAAVFESAGMVCADGVPLLWLTRLRGGHDGERVCGPDVMLTLSDRGRTIDARHFYVGGAPGTAHRLAARLSKMYPGLVVAGTASPPFRELTDEEDEGLVNEINAAAPDIVWIGLGSPKQEIWAAEHAERLEASLVLPVGAAFDFHSGRLRRAPRWLRRFGLEWLFRLAVEPRRLFRRYLVTNSRFVVLVTREELGRFRRPKGEAP